MVGQKSTPGRFAVVADQSLISAEKAAIALPVGVAAVRAVSPGDFFFLDHVMSPGPESQFLFPNIDVE
jgi:hypothetical protein